MRNALPSALVLSFAFLLSACATTRAPFVPSPPQPNTGGVYFYRPSEMHGRLIKPTLSANGAALGKLANDSCAVAYLPPGQVSVRSLWPGIPGQVRDDSAPVSVEAGRNRYLRVRYHVGDSHRVAPGAGIANALVYEDRPGLEEVEEKEAVPQMAGMGPCPAFAPAP